MNERGIIQSRERARQLLLFDGMQYGNITPTDIDFIIEYKGIAYVIIEVKHRGKDVPTGQKLALTRMVDDFARAGKRAVLLVCEHAIDNPGQDVRVKDTEVRNLYFEGAWHPKGGRKYSGIKAGEIVSRFISGMEA